MRRLKTTDWKGLGKSAIGAAAAYSYETTIAAGVKDASNFKGMPAPQVVAQPIFWGNLIAAWAPIFVSGMLTTAYRSPMAMGYLSGTLYQRIDNMGQGWFGLPPTVLIRRGVRM